MRSVATLVAVVVTVAIVWHVWPTHHAPSPGVAASPAVTDVTSRAAELTPPPAWAQKLLTTDVPAASNQAVLVHSASMSDSTNTVTLWSRVGGSWTEAGSALPGYNGAHGWTTNRVQGDLATPAGVFTLTYGGGSLPNPGSRLPYEFDPGFFRDSGTFLGQSLTGVFNYVVAIDFNRQPGSPPSDPTEPQGPGPGGGIWLHVSNGTATEGCVTVSQQGMLAILRWITPSDQPVIVMGMG